MFLCISVLILLNWKYFESFFPFLEEFLCWLTQRRARPTRSAQANRKPTTVVQTLRETRNRTLLLMLSFPLCILLMLKFEFSFFALSNVGKFIYDTLFLGFYPVHLSKAQSPDFKEPMGFVAMSQTALIMWVIDLSFVFIPRSLEIFNSNRLNVVLCVLNAPLRIRDFSIRRWKILFDQVEPLVLCSRHLQIWNKISLITSKWIGNSRHKLDHCLYFNSFWKWLIQNDIALAPLDSFLAKKNRKRACFYSPDFTFLVS